MRNNLVVIVVGAVIVSYLLISPFAGDRAVGQPKAVPASAVGRYQMAACQIQSPFNQKMIDKVLVLDTQTGQVWGRMMGDRDWSDWGNPAPKDKKE